MKGTSRLSRHNAADVTGGCGRKLTLCTSVRGGWRHRYRRCQRPSKTGLRLFMKASWPSW